MAEGADPHWVHGHHHPLRLGADGSRAGVLHKDLLHHMDLEGGQAVQVEGLVAQGHSAEGRAAVRQQLLQGLRKLRRPDQALPLLLLRTPAGNKAEGSRARQLPRNHVAEAGHAKERGVPRVQAGVHIPEQSWAQLGSHGWDVHDDEAGARVQDAGAVRDVDVLRVRHDRLLGHQRVPRQFSSQQCREPGDAAPDGAPPCRRERDPSPWARLQHRQQLGPGGGGRDGQQLGQIRERSRHHGDHRFDCLAGHQLRVVVQLPLPAQFHREAGCCREQGPHILTVRVHDRPLLARHLQVLQHLQQAPGYGLRGRAPARALLQQVQQVRPNRVQRGVLPQAQPEGQGLVQGPQQVGPLAPNPLPPRGRDRLLQKPETHGSVTCTGGGVGHRRGGRREAVRVDADDQRHPPHRLQARLAVLPSAKDLVAVPLQVLQKPLTVLNEHIVRQLALAEEGLQPALAGDQQVEVQPLLQPHLCQDVQVGDVIWG
mmetsp:Transcript_124954/g.216615  ORF Transcript_124954/g.216615 Transcript_124954/m.216615 type:complete len:484 (+) Transcript_124954:473-1924(+)